MLLRHPATFKTFGVNIPRQVLLHGPRGSGKALIARVVANEAGAFLFRINVVDILSKDIPDAARMLRQALAEAARTTPPILFIDDIDLLAKKRSATRVVILHWRRFSEYRDL